MLTKIDVLNNGFVRLVSYMQPVPEEPHHRTVEGIDHVRVKPWTGDLEIVRNARVSFDADWRDSKQGGDKDEKLLRYMYRNHHTSPFEAMVFTFEVKAPIFIFRQWHRHRTWSYNEISARYTELETDYYIPDADNIGRQSKTNKQARDIEKIDDAEGNVITMLNANAHSFAAYELLLDSGVPRELARAVLPVATYSRMFATVDLHNLAHFIRLRSDSHAQWEIQQYSNALLELIRPVVPIASALIEIDVAKANEVT